MNHYVVATIKSWNVENFHRYSEALPGKWHLVTDKSDLTEIYLKKISPRYIFFPHWSWIVPSTIITNYECVCFHMTDVPYGRGGSPLQNLIVRGHKLTKLSALRMTEHLDAGPVYLKYPLTLDGCAEDILKRASLLSYEAIKTIVKEQVKPEVQEGAIIPFSRRTPEQSEISDYKNIESIFDHIRMLDGEGYPRAFLESKGFKFEFSQAKYSKSVINANVTITKSENDE